MSDLEAPDWLEPWAPVHADQAGAFEAELRAELGPGHSIYGRDAQAIARREDRDDVLFAFAATDEVAVVHLTYARHPEEPPWPSTNVYESLAAFATERMAQDHSDF